MARIAPRFIDARVDEPKQHESLDFSLGYNSHLANDVLPENQLRLATDARIPTVGRYMTRKGLDFYSVPAGETVDQQQTSATGAASKDISKTAWLAAKYTAGANGRLTKAEIELKNTDSASGRVVVEIYSDSSGPSVLLAQSSIPASTPTSSNAYCAARFIEAPEQVSGTSYWIVAYIQFDGSSTYKWNSTTAATTSKISVNSGVTWSSTTYAMHVKTYVSPTGGTLGHFRARKSDGTVKTLIAYREAAGTTAVATVNDVTGALTAIKTGLSSSATYYDFEQVQDVVYYVNGYDPPRKWDFTTEALMAGSPHVSTRLKWHKDQMFLLLADDPARVDWSDKTDPEAFTSTNFQYIPAPKSNDPVVNWAILNDNLYFLTTKTKWAIYGSDITNIILRKVPGSKGTISPDTVVVDGTNIYFAAYDNFYAFNGTSDTPLAGAILDEYRAATNRNDMSAGVWNDRLYIFYTPSGGGQNSRCWVINLSLGGAVESNDTGTYVQRVQVWSTGDDYSEFVQASNLVGALYYAERDSNAFTNLGKALSYELRPKYYFEVSPSWKTHVDDWRPRFVSQVGQHSVTCTYDGDLSDTPSTVVNGTVSMSSGGILADGSHIVRDGSVVGGSSLVKPRLSIPGYRSYTQPRYSCVGSNTPVEFIGQTLRTSSKFV